MRTDFTAFLEQTGMGEAGVRPDMIRDLGDGTWLAIKPLMFHWTMLRGEIGDTVGYFDRWCYADETGARMAFSCFPDRPAPDYEPAGWHRHPPTMRRRPDADRSLEYLEP